MLCIILIRLQHNIVHSDPFALIPFTKSPSSAIAAAEAAAAIYYNTTPMVSMYGMGHAP